MAECISREEVTQFAATGGAALDCGGPGDKDHFPRPAGGENMSGRSETGWENAEPTTAIHRSLSGRLAVGLLVSGCDWTQLGFNSSHNGDNEFDTSITPANVSSLSQQFIASDGTGGVPLPQAVVNGVLYASDSAGLEAYSADGTTDCTASSPATCTPEWSYDTGSLGDSPDGTQRNISVVNGVVYISTSSGLEAFDAAGQKNCSGSPALSTALERSGRLR